MTLKFEQRFRHCVRVKDDSIAIQNEQCIGRVLENESMKFHGPILGLTQLVNLSGIKS